MDINDLTEEQKTTLLYHFRAAVLARARQWDHELKIEALLGHEVDIDIEMWAANVDDASELIPDDLTFVEWDDIKEELTES
jgi:hypothetical protein